MLTGIHVYIVHFYRFTLFARNMPARARGLIYLELIMMYLFYDYSNVNRASGLEK